MALHKFSLDCRGTSLDQLLPGQTRKSWDICRSRWWIGWLLGDEYHHVEIVVPPVIVLGSVTAGALYNALSEMPWCRPINDFLQRAGGLAKVRMCLREPDGASNNLKLMAFEALSFERSLFQHKL